MATQKALDKAYMECAIAISRLSHAKRLKVGAIIVSPDNHIISEGTNGSPSGFDNNCEDEVCEDSHFFIAKTRAKITYCDNCKKEWSDEEWKHVSVGPCNYLVTKPEVLHSESNAISKLACSTNSSKGATLYVTASPCFECAKLIIQAKIVRVVYKQLYRKTEGIDLLRKAGIECEQIEE